MKLRAAISAHNRLLEMKPVTVVAKSRAIAAVLGLEDAEFYKISFRRPNLLYQSSDRMRRRIERLASVFGTSEAEVLQHVLQSGGALLTRSPEAVSEAIDELSDALGLKRSVVRSMLLRGGSVGTMRGSTMVRKAEALQVYLGVDRAQFGKIIARRPSLLARDLKSVKALVRELARGLGVTQAAVLGIVRTCPQIALQKASTLIGNFEKLEFGLGITKAEAAKLVCSLPALLYLDARRVSLRYWEACNRLGISLEDGREALRRAGSRVLAREPVKLTQKMRLVSRIARLLGEDLTRGEVFLRYPVAGSYAMDHLIIRYGVARSGLWQGGWIQLLQVSAGRIEMLVKDGADESPERREALRALLNRMG